jgi:hypothetical protein
MFCHNVEFKMKNYQLRCALAMLTFRAGAADSGLVDSCRKTLMPLYMIIKCFVYNKLKGHMDPNS